MKITKLLSIIALAASPLLASAEDGSNSLVENGTFKKNGMGWESVTKEECGSVEYIQEEEEGYARLSPINSKYPNIVMSQRSFVPTDGGEFLASAKIRVSADYDQAKPPQVSFNVFNPSGTEPRSQQFSLKPSEFAEPGKWTEVTLPVTIPAGSPRVWIQCTAYGKAGTVDFTEVTLKAK